MSEAAARPVVVVTFPGAQILDVTGPTEVFSSAGREERERALETGADTGAGGDGLSRAPGPLYALEVVASRPGPITSTCGIQILAGPLERAERPPIDTLIVAGGDGTAAALRDRQLIEWIREHGPRARRLASVCTGAFLLAEAGLLDGRRATTHWGACRQLARHYPAVCVEPDPIFVRDGHVYSSAGVCAGMDLALALVEEDHGRDLALAVAQRLVVFLRRPGGQSQFSAQLRAQMAEREPLRDLQGWIAENPRADLSVDALARRVGMSPRNFARVFTREVGATPARFVEQVRVEAARRRLEESALGVEQVADLCGFGSAETMRRAFLRGLRVSPSDYRERFRGAGPRGAPDPVPGPIPGSPENPARPERRSP